MLRTGPQGKAGTAPEHLTRQQSRKAAGGHPKVCQGISPSDACSSRREARVPTFPLMINGKSRRVTAAPDTPLLWVLRDLLRMTGTKYGCGVGVCGACTIHQGNVAVRSCQIPISAAAGKSYTTIEGLSSDGSHPCQRAWIELDVAQCGYCQAGMIMAAAALLRQKSNPTDAEIDTVMSDLVCRCGTYQRIRQAIHRAAGEGKKP